MSDHVYAISEIVGSSSEASEMPSRTRWRARKTVRPRRLAAPDRLRGTARAMGALVFPASAAEEIELARSLV